MLKSIVGVIVGYIVMAIVGFAVLACAYFALGADRVFEQDSYTLSTVWIALMIAVGLVGGILGGLTCAAISKSKGACTAFAVIVLVLGLLGSLTTMRTEHSSEARAGDIQMWEAMRKADNPTWLSLLNPVISAAGVMLGARMKKNPTV